MIHLSGKKQENNRYEMTGTDTIPPALISSLNTLGLTNDEARVYATLVLFDHAEAKEIVDYLSLSKPSVYKALENLAGRGLAVQQKSKPARYRAISPEMAVSILMRDHENASEQALSALKTLEQEKVRTDKEDALWTIYGDTNIEYKIQELFRKAKNQISCIVGDRYVRFLENVPVRNIPLRLIILSSSEGLSEKMHKKFPGNHTDIHIIPLKKLASPPPGFTIPEIDEAWKYLKFENVLEINVDDDELLMSAAFLSRGASVLNTRNKGAIIQMKMLGQLFWSRLLEGNEP
jgi:HTH-type transcriptional regulator, sugar sensing transcriptional regulator